MTAASNVKGVQHGSFCVDVPNPHAVRGVSIKYDGDGTQPLDAAIFVSVVLLLAVIAVLVARHTMLVRKLTNGQRGAFE